MSPPRLRLFRSESDADLFGYTFDETGSVLPVDLGPWQPFSGNPSIGITIPQVVLIKRDGFLLQRQGAAPLDYKRKLN